MPTGAKPRLLIADDEELNLALLGHILENSEFELVWARDGEEALKKLSEVGSCDAVLLDWMMPKMGGLEVLGVMKSDARFRSIPVIMQTAAGGEAKMRQAMEAGAHSYVLKPYDDETILQAIRDVLAQRGCTRLRKPMAASDSAHSSDRI